MAGLLNSLPVSLADCRDVLVEASAIIRRHYDARSAAATKADGSPVTMADREANDFLQSALSRLLPSAAWLSEESVDSRDRLNAEWVWIVDPLDGTKEFVRAVPEFAISIALVRGHDVVLGGIMNPITLEGAAGSTDGKTIRWNCAPAAPPARDLAGARAIVSRSETEDGTILPFMGLAGIVRPVGSVAYKLLRVAAGLDDLTFSVQPKKEWDVCGGIALLNSFGKTYRRLDGLPNRFNNEQVYIPCGAVAGDSDLVDRFIQEYRTVAARLAASDGPLPDHGAG